MIKEVIIKGVIKIKPLKVSELNNYIKKIFSSDMILSNIQIEGEISNFKKHISGHLYFSLKDNNSLIKCVMFRGDALNIVSNLAEGQKIIAEGYVSIYERNGEYQLYIKKIKDNGVGELYEAYENLKIKLENEGLFESRFKKELPFLPSNIGVVTSPTGAAVHDIINIINRRFPSCKITIYPSLVQGMNAPKEIIKALKFLDNNEAIDLIIVGRGGGSMEDLFCFNDEDLARCIFNLKTPIISAVGHETDFTIADFISDLRAPTPSAAAELAVPDVEHLSHNLNSLYYDLKNSFKKHLRYRENSINIIKGELKYNNPYLKLRNNRQDLDMLLKDFVSSTDNNINEKFKSLVSLENKLQLLNPLLALENGYGILTNKDGDIIRSVESLKLNDIINIKIKNGELKVILKEIKKES
ncbi:exodeoxyribonuclease VII large subunit [Tissierella creatinophila]|uniref:Exodeoxyribonuclease 7 large subunit n=1 Tax=Tissierella creatinophila DSM 6911 TaxID=1123403 RepID=A0A1U7M9E6_TISCR|nr:exodeoxyribonuclease VII large subunit [Tissierella creatinophila]OLS03942.1 exodeoxyribonuclease 7 large subunit [Tissierella creatinophila DSM 6911]